jgi:hypothetical protein
MRCALTDCAPQTFLICTVCDVTLRVRGAMAYIQTEAIGHQAVRPLQISL